MPEFPRFDTSKPSIARVYDYWLGGKDNFAADREQADKLEQLYPEIRRVAVENRGFLKNAVTWAAGQGITQFIDLGSGLPTAENTHQVAREANPGARVVYVDFDPVVVSHANALLTGDGVAAVHADLRDSSAVLGDSNLRGLIDLTQPVALIFACVLHFIPADQAREIVARYAAWLAAGSSVMISVVTGDADMFGTGKSAYAAAELQNHSPEEIEGFFGGMDLVPPGVVQARAWRGGMDERGPRLSGNASALVGVARVDRPSAAP